jgi:hypothetical protein
MSGELRQIELSSPILTLVALYWVANNRPEWTGMDGKTMIATGFGIASADYIRDKIKEFAPEFAKTLGDEALQAIAGALIYRYGARIHPLVQDIGRGVLLDVVARAMKEAGFTLERFFGGLLKQGCSSCGDSMSQDIEIPSMTPRNAYEYALMKYGRGEVYA